MSTRTRQKNKRGDSKAKSNDSPEIPDRGETSDIPSFLGWVGGGACCCRLTLYHTHPTTLSLLCFVLGLFFSVTVPLEQPRATQRLHRLQRHDAVLHAQPAAKQRHHHTSGADGAGDTAAAAVSGDHGHVPFLLHQSSLRPAILRHQGRQPHALPG